MTRNRIGRGVRFNDETGISIIELLIAMIITTIISAALVGSIYFGFRATSTTETHLAQSAKANILASYFAQDVQNATGVGKSVNEAASACGSGATQVALLLTQDTATPSLSSISYYTATVNNSLNLYRRTCNAGVPSTPIMVAKGLKDDQTPAKVWLTVTCAPFDPLSGACVNSNPSNGIPDWVSVTLAIAQHDSKGQSPYPTTVIGTKRVS